MTCIVVIGGVAAGMSAASQARRRDPACEVIVLHRGSEISYSACGMPYNIGDPARTLDDLIILKAQAARSERGIDVRTRHEVLGIDLARRSWGIEASAFFEQVSGRHRSGHRRTGWA